MVRAHAATHQVHGTEDRYQCQRNAGLTRWQRRIVRTLIYGIFFGAVGMYLYMTQGALLDSTITAMLQWRDGAKQSVYGYGGKE